MFHKLARLLRIGYKDRFHSRGQLPCNFKEVFTEERIGLVKQDGRRLTVFESQIGCRNVM